jgi:GNAT superfamily N-acetyltransferase
MAPVDVTVSRAARDFEAWDALLDLILASFAYMNGRIDPPSSALLLTPAALRQKSETETLLLAFLGERLAGCAFLSRRADHVYVGKLAVAPDLQGRGIGKKLLTESEGFARVLGVGAMELQTRIELNENHRTFTRLGYSEVGRSAHSGYDRPTTVTLRKILA